MKSIPRVFLFALTFSALFFRANAEEGLLVSEVNQVKLLDGHGHAKVLLHVSGPVQTVDQEIYLAQGKKVRIYNLQGSNVRAISLPAEVDSYVDFAVLPDKRMAFFDNQNDAVYFTAADGAFLKRVPLFDKPDSERQNMQGIVANDALVICENGRRQIVSIDLKSFALSTFLDLSAKRVSVLGSIAFAGGKFYFSAGGTKIYSFSAGASEIELVAECPEGNIVGLAALGTRLFAASNGIKRSEDPAIGRAKSGIVYEIHPYSKTAPVISSGLYFPEDLVALKESNSPDLPIGAPQKGDSLDLR